MDGLRSFVEGDNHSAVDVGHLRKGTRPFYVQKPNFSEDCPEVAAGWSAPLTAGGEAGSSGSQLLDLGDMWRHG